MQKQLSVNSYTNTPIHVEARKIGSDWLNLLLSIVAALLLQDHCMYSCAMFTLVVCVCVNVTVKFNIVSMEMQTQTHGMGLNPFCASDGDVDTDANANVKCEHSITRVLVDWCQMVHIFLLVHAPTHRYDYFASYVPQFSVETCSFPLPLLLKFNILWSIDRDRITFTIKFCIYNVTFLGTFNLHWESTLI